MRQRTSKRLKALLTAARTARVLRKGRRNPELARVLRSYRSGQPLNAITQPTQLLRHLVQRPIIYRCALQQPAQFYMPDLPSAPFLEPDRISRFLVENVEAIRAEYAAFCGDETPTPSKHLVSAGKWNTVPLMRKEGVFASNVAQFPRTWALMQQLPLLPSVHGGIYFSVLEPGSHIAPHCGPTNLRVRYHLTIMEAAGAQIRCGTQWRSWEENGCLLLDDSFEHEVRHQGSGRRVVLIVDCWHPDLSQAERVFLSELYEVWFPGGGWITRAHFEGGTTAI